MSDKKSFIAYKNWKSTFDELSDEDAGKLVKHIFEYVNGSDEKSDSVLIRAVFANIKDTIDRDIEKWETQLEQRRLAGIRSAEARKSTSVNDRSTTVDERERNSTDSVSDSVTVSDSDNENEKKGKRGFTPPTPTEVSNYAKERGDTIDGERFCDFYASKGWMVGKNKMKDWKAAVRNWLRDKKPTETKPQQKSIYKLNSAGRPIVGVYADDYKP